MDNLAKRILEKVRETAAEMKFESEEKKLNWIIDHMAEGFQRILDAQHALLMKEIRLQHERDAAHFQSVTAWPMDVMVRHPDGTNTILYGNPAHDPAKAKDFVQ